MNREALFEVGIVGLAAVVAAGVAILLGGGFAEGVLQRMRGNESAPSAGTVDPERHHHVQAPAAH
jgi:5-formyltetrahydrofolate cyclo-ligase